MGTLSDAALEVRLDHSSPVPLYHQAALALEAAITEGRLAAGSQLDSETDLAEQLGVSRPTVRAALKELVDKGLLVRRRGIGTVVAAVPITRPLALTSLHTDLAKAGRRPHTRVLALQRTNCPADLCDVLRLSEGDAVYDVWRLRFADDEPIALMHNVLPAEGVELDEEALEAGSLYGLLREQGMGLHAATQRIGAVAADDEHSELLDVDPGSPLVAVIRTTYDTGGRPVEHARLLYPAHAYEVEMTLVDRQ